MNPYNLAHNIDNTVTGRGFKRTIPGITLTSLRDADGTILTGSTVPDVKALETSFYGLEVAANETDLGTLMLVVPRDYDADVDKMRVRFLCNSAGTTDAPTITAAVYRKRAGAALSSDLAPAASAAISKASATTGTAWTEIKIESEDLEPGDALFITFTLSAHTTDAINFFGMEVAYIGDLAYYVTSERDDWER
jgi:hypothetical protein